jgi:hypothetical protein
VRHENRILEALDQQVAEARALADRLESSILAKIFRDEL